MVTVCLMQSPGSLGSEGASRRASGRGQSHQAPEGYQHDSRTLRGLRTMAGYKLIELFYEARSVRLG